MHASQPSSGNKPILVSPLLLFIITILSLLLFLSLLVLLLLYFQAPIHVSEYCCTDISDDRLYSIIGSRTREDHHLVFVFVTEVYTSLKPRRSNLSRRHWPIVFNWAPSNNATPNRLQNRQFSSEICHGSSEHVQTTAVDQSGRFTVKYRGTDSTVEILSLPFVRQIVTEYCHSPDILGLQQACFTQACKHMVEEVV